MSSIRFSSFGAATMPLSKIVVDKELDMGTYPIKTDAVNEKTVGNGVIVDGLLIKDGVSNSPYRPQAWPTETLDWCDTEAADIPTTATGYIQPNSSKTIFEFDGAGDSTRFYRYALNIDAPNSQEVAAWYFQLTQNGVVTYTSPDVTGNTGFAVDLSILGGAHVTGQIFYRGKNTALYLYGATLHTTGYAVGMVITEVWLALGLDMLALDVTVKIQGVDMPYDDYAKYFPLAPSELTLPGDWDASQTRPVVKVYK